MKRDTGQKSSPFPEKKTALFVTFLHLHYYIITFLLGTLESGIEVGPTVINLAFFSRPYALIRDYIKVI